MYFCSLNFVWCSSVAVDTREPVQLLRTGPSRAPGGLPGTVLKRGSMLVPATTAGLHGPQPRHRPPRPTAAQPLGCQGLSPALSLHGEAGKAMKMLGCSDWALEHLQQWPRRWPGWLLQAALSEGTGGAAAPGKPGSPRGRRAGLGAARAEGQSRRGAAVASLCLRDFSHPNLDHVGLRRGG